MKVSDFDYKLPKELIAKFPVEPRDSSRLMVLNKNTGKIEHRIFKDIVEYLKAGDVLVINDTKVIPARLFGKLDTGGKVEILLVRQPGLNTWEVMAKPARKLKKGRKISFDEELEAVVKEYSGEGKRIIEFVIKSNKDFMEKIEEIGHIPLPPYIEREEKPEDREKYQTVFARKEGAVAAPTAGLHFTTELLENLKSKGIIIKNITLHVGPGTFKPVKVENVEDHQMDYETYYVPEDTAIEINRAKEEGRRVIAVGTTVTRTLESAADESGKVKQGEDSTNLFIYPGYKFKVIDALITNFHLPRSTLLMLVSAFAGKERILNAYKEAVRKGYRFYSYGDAMFIF
ncbi:S-adenosylmethionine:tRNAribosyltransferase-isomerase [Desulfurobacterium thermolithotrophum DSM 11699]|uniref:S-adenosylmethionine:tRNA ribosyltransferase-isomerase n=1 Tax=Desulfurobacterium thermolithotrophum (strain DSM 11699 / BSA) TaxID=868864 RepID=F0S207_DESTD|nr:tRNA preQ1(34) S-adenosylmethionine ribosyltransferase-isomerase QueA [Desulfurobacterium thermolithotrophum]ADY74088.1 S-adenosylmethionine:tRNAribosyltransferase-isomerase [Desulfurobacterium thermolithotrophum DSM 11699]